MTSIWDYHRIMVHKPDPNELFSLDGAAKKSIYTFRPRSSA